jgi:hypothetical protein
MKTFTKELRPTGRGLPRVDLSKALKAVPLRKVEAAAPDTIPAAPDAPRRGDAGTVFFAAAPAQQQIAPATPATAPRSPTHDDGSALPQTVIDRLDREQVTQSIGEALRAPGTPVQYGYLQSGRGQR